MPNNSNSMSLPSNFKGTQIGEFPGGKIYTDGIQHGSISISANLFGFSFGTEYDTITGGFNTPTSRSVTHGPLKLEVDNNGNIKTGVVAGPYEGGVVNYSDGTQGIYAGASLRAKFAEIGVSVDGTLPEHNTNLSTYNSTTVFADGTVIKTEFRDINNVGFESGVAAFSTTYKNGKLVKTDITPVDGGWAASMKAGTAPRCFAAGTLIRMADGLEKPIELIRPGDVVASFDEAADGGRGALVGKCVVRTFVNENQIVTGSLRSR